MPQSQRRSLWWRRDATAVTALQDGEADDLAWLDVVLEVHPGASPGLPGQVERSRPPVESRRSERDHVGEEWIAVMFLEVGLLLVGFGAGVACLTKGRRRLGWALLGVGVVATLLTFFAAGLLYAAAPFAVVAVALAARAAPSGTGTVEEQHQPAPVRLRSVLVGAALGMLPGVLVVAVPMVLHSLGVITSDQSQIAFIGMPLGFIGLVVGAAMGATRSRPTDSASRSDSIPTG